MKLPSALFILAGLIAAGLVIVTVYAAVRQSPALLGVELMTGAAASLTGALVGFVFGIPRTLQQECPVPPSSGSMPQLPSSPTADIQYRFNTNLEQISDWLTKILVGVGLTQVYNAADALGAFAEGIAQDIQLDGTRPFTVAVVVYFLVGGFLLGYLWTRLVYAGLLISSDVSALERLGLQVERTRRMAAGVMAVMEYGVGKKRLGSGEVRHTEAVLVGPPGVALAPIICPDDPNKGRFGGHQQANGRLLLGTVDGCSGAKDWFEICLRVTSTDPTRPLVTSVWFYLHDTFEEPVVEVPVTEGMASLEVVSYGAFTVGAIADQGQTRLELDLAGLPEAPRRFRER